MTPLALLPQIALFFLLILCSALFSGTETALFTLRRHRLSNYRDEHPRAVRILEKILNQPREFISTILICNNFVNVAASALATRICIELWGESGVIIATIVVTVILLIGAEITPKTYAAARPENITIRTALPLRMLITILMPVNRFLSLAVNLLLRLMGLPGRSQSPSLSDEEIKSIIMTGKQEGLLRESESSMITNVLDIDKTRARRVMKPRAQIISLALDSSLKKINEIVKKHGFSRYPVYDRELENIVGILHIKDLFRTTSKPFSLRPLLRPACFFPETATLDDLLEKFRQYRISLGIVVDEYGGIEGILSRDDIVSEIVGHLADETDHSLPSTITTLKEGAYLIPGTLSLRKIEQAIPKLKFPREIEYDHLAGLILGHLGQIPKPGATIHLDNMKLEVTKTALNRIVMVKVTPLAGTSDTST
ncbi:MAG: HlyC/CorC family transporter [Deltaproteobacteria bacterium]|nr:HlyC/CorC family transporter [Deltaproteobacteria bacterium]